MATKKQFTIGALVLVILTASVYIFLPENVRIDVTGTYTSFKVWENERWVLAGTEYTKVYEGSTNLKASSRSINYSINNISSTIIRTAIFKNNITVIDIYTFDGGTKDVELFPISHEIKVLNAKGKILQYEVNDLLYSGTTLKDIESPQSFGHKMKLEWQTGNYYSQLFKYSGKDVGKVTVKYKIDSNDYNVDVRLFDPIIICYQEFVDQSTVCGGLDTGSYRTSNGDPLSSWIDGDWDTSANNPLAMTIYFYINYTVPIGTTANSMWQIKDYNVGIRNLSLASCELSSTLRLQINFSRIVGGVGNISYHCFNGADLIKLTDITSSSAALYEEAIWWNISELPVITIQSPVNNTNYSTNSIDLNWTVDITPSWCAYSLDNGSNISLMNEGLCYQESANVSTDCGGLSTGKYSYSIGFPNSPERYYDGNYLTETVFGYNGEGYIYSNYTKPINALNSSLWQVAYDFPVVLRNISINNNCWIQPILQFRTTSGGTEDTQYSNFSCWNGSIWLSLYNGLNGESTIYEESIWWNLSSHTINTTLTSLSDGLHNLTIYCNDTSNVQGQSAYTYFSVDMSAPIWTVIPANKTLNYYQAFGVGFTATDTSGISTYFINDTVRFQINSSGWLSNKTRLAASNYYINVSVNDTLGLVNSTIYYLNVTRQEPTVGITITGISGEYPDEITIEAYSQDRYTSEEDVMVMNLFINGTLVANPYTVTLAAGDYNITYNGTINENYTSVALYYYGTYTQDYNYTDCGIVFNTSSPITYPTHLNVTTNCTSAYTLYRNGTTFNNGENQILGAGSYNFTVIRTDWQNYSIIRNQSIFNVNQGTPLLSLSVTNTNITYPVTTTGTGSGCPGELSCSLLKNGTVITNGVGIQLGVGYYNYTYNTSGNTNYTSYQIENIFYIAKNNGSCDMLFNESSPLAQGLSFKAYTNCSSAFQLLRNGTIIANNSDQTLTEGYYNFTVYRNDTQNYTYVTDTEIFVITNYQPDTKVEFSCGNTNLKFRITNLTGQNLEPTSQNISCPAYNITNNGTGTGSLLKVRLNQSLPSGIEMRIPSYNSTFCYQESANVSTSCGGLSSGSYYNCDGVWNDGEFISEYCESGYKLYDGDWGTSASAASFFDDGILYFNYTKPVGALNSSLWQVKDYDGIFNLSIPTGCWNNTDLLFYVTAHSQTGTGDTTRWFCYNGSDWSLLRSISGAYKMTVYEEAMWWDVNYVNLTTSFQTIYNSTITVNQSIGIYLRLDLNNPTSGSISKLIFNITN